MQAERAGTGTGKRWTVRVRGPRRVTYLTPEEVADQLRVSRRTVYGWLKLGKLRGLRAGKAWRVRSEDIEAFLLPAAAWERRLDQMLARTRSRIPTGMTPAEIESEISAAMDEVRSGRRAGGS